MVEGPHPDALGRPLLRSQIVFNAGARMFCFLGAFALPPGKFKSEFARIWPDADFARIKKPIRADAVRLTRMTKADAERELPSQIIEALKSLSTKYRDAQFLLLRADCWGGPCSYVGVTVKAGTIQAQESGDKSLRRMILPFGADLGERQIFPPLTRNFKWRPVKRKGLFAFWR